MYLAVLLMSLILAFIAFANPRLDGLFFKIEILALSLFLCFRYGQGTDYFNYMRMYEQNMVGIDLKWLFHNNVHGEIGYKVLEGISKAAGFSFVFFLGIMSFFMMVFIYRGINKYSTFKTLSIALLIPTFYFTYDIGIVREGIALSVVVGLLLKTYIDKKYFKYCIIVLLLCSIHKYAIVLLVPIITVRIKQLKSKKLQIVMGIICGGVLWFLLYALNIKISYIRLSPSYGAILLRVLLFYLTTRLYKTSQIDEEIDKPLYKFYSIGFILYIVTCPIALISHRLTAYMKVSEIILIPRLIQQRRAFSLNPSGVTQRWKSGVMILLLSMLFVEGVKNINSYIEQGEYYNFVNVWNYPYISVFNQEDIYSYRYDDVFTLVPNNGEV